MGKFSWEREGGCELSNVREVRLLGEFLMDVVGSSPNQVKEAVGSMRGKVDGIRIKNYQTCPKISQIPGYLT